MIVYINHRQKNRREDRRDRIQEKQEDLLETIRKNKDENPPADSSS